MGEWDFLSVRQRGSGRARRRTHKSHHPQLHFDHAQTTPFTFLGVDHGPGNGRHPDNTAARIGPIRLIQLMTSCLTLRGGLDQNTCIIWRRCTAPPGCLSLRLQAAGLVSGLVSQILALGKVTGELTGDMADEEFKHRAILMMVMMIS